MVWVEFIGCFLWVGRSGFGITFVLRSVNEVGVTLERRTGRKGDREGIRIEGRAGSGDVYGVFWIGFVREEVGWVEDGYWS